MPKGADVIDFLTGRKLTPLEIEAGIRFHGEDDLLPFLYTDLPDEVIVEAMVKASQGEEPGIDLRAHAISRDEWLKRQDAERPLPSAGSDPERRRLRKQKKRKKRKR